LRPRTKVLGQSIALGDLFKLGINLFVILNGFRIFDF